MTFFLSFVLVIVTLSVDSLREITGLLIVSILLVAISAMSSYWAYKCVSEAGVVRVND